MKTAEQIMEIIQEHASTWSLAGGRFDDGTMFEQAKQQKAALRTAIEELHRDAARYLWLRENYNSQVLVCRNKLDARDEWPEYSHEALDAAIDAAMDEMSIMQININKAFSDWYDSYPDGEPTYQEAFEAGAAIELADLKAKLAVVEKRLHMLLMPVPAKDVTALDVCKVVSERAMEIIQLLKGTP